MSSVSQSMPESLGVLVLGALLGFSLVTGNCSCLGFEKDYVEIWSR